MRIAGLIQARCSSARLPGKMLRPLHGRPMIDWVVDAARRARGLDDLAVATSTADDDDALADRVRALGVTVCRGPLDDVAGRLLASAEELGADAIVRINGDSPLLDPALVDRGVALFRAETGLDLASNVVVRSFPKGQSVEVVAVAALRRAVAAMTTAAEREHATPYFYAHPRDFRIRGFTADAPAPALQMSIDTADDFDRCAEIIAQFDGNVAGLGWRMLADRFLAREAAP